MKIEEVLSKREKMILLKFIADPLTFETAKKALILSFCLNGYWNASKILKKGFNELMELKQAKNQQDDNNKGRNPAR